MIFGQILTNIDPCPRLDHKQLHGMAGVGGKLHGDK